MSDGASESLNGAVHLLDREIPADYLHAWTERIASENVVTEAGTNSVLVFRVGPEWLGLPVQIFEEVAEHCVLHTVPHRRGGTLAGLVNVRGELLLCASLGALLGVESGGARIRDDGRIVCDRLLVARRDASRLAFPVDEVQGVVRYHPRELKPVPATLANASATFTIGLLPWSDRTIGCLDDELLFYKLEKSFS